MQKPAELAEKLFGLPYEALDERAKNVARLLAERKHVARDSAKELDAAMTRGQRAADAVAAFGGSWIFITCFIAIMIVWVGLNSLILAKRTNPAERLRPKGLLSDFQLYRELRFLI